MTSFPQLFFRSLAHHYCYDILFWKKWNMHILRLSWRTAFQWINLASRTWWWWWCLLFGLKQLVWTMCRLFWISFPHLKTRRFYTRLVISGFVEMFPKGNAGIAFTRGHPQHELSSGCPLLKAVCSPGSYSLLYSSMPHASSQGVLGFGSSALDNKILQDCIWNLRASFQFLSKRT